MSKKLQHNRPARSAGQKDKAFHNRYIPPNVRRNPKHNCEGTIMESEVLKSLKSYKKGKSPGTDGLTAEFYYEYFWQV